MGSTLGRERGASAEQCTRSQISCRGELSYTDRARPPSIFQESIRRAGGLGAWSVHPHARLSTSGRRASPASIAPPTLLTWPRSTHMPLKNDDVVSVLVDLIETCQDGLQGFKPASESVENPAAKPLFQ